MTDYLARVHGHYASGQKWGFGWHITSNQPLATLLTTWTNAVTAWWTNGTNGLNTVFPTGTILDNVDVTQLNGSQKFAARATSAALALPGTSADNGLPDEVSAVVSLRSTSLDKGSKGRTKLPAPVEGVVVNGEFASTFTTRVAAATRGLLAAVNADGSTVYVFNRIVTLSKPTALTKTVITSLFASNKVGTVRKRTKKVSAVYS